MADQSIPTKMKAVQLVKHIAKWPENAEELREYIVANDDVDVPVPKSGEVLIRVERTPINPADLSGLKGSYNASGRPNLPTIPGREGSGVVVSSGGGILGWRLVGKRVAAAHQGFWGQYVAVPATHCIVLPDDVSFATGASAWVNPMTVLGFLDVAEAGKHKTIVHTAAASALGKMLIQAAKLEGIDIIGIVRKPEQVDELLAAGAKAAFSTSSETWATEFKEKCAELKCTLAFDAVAGETTGYVLHNMPKKSVVYVYGGLSEQPCSIPPGDFIFQQKRVEGFWVSEYLASRSFMKVFMWQRKVASLLNTVFNTTVSQTFDADHIADAILDYRGNMSRGKILLNPQPEGAVAEVEGKGKDREKVEAEGESEGAVPAHEEKEKKDEEKEKKDEGESDAQQQQPAAGTGVVGI